MPESRNSHEEKGPPPSSPKPLASWYAQGLSDGLGDRLLMFDNSDAPSLELLRFRPELAQIPGFETALRDQVHRLDQFRHPAFARVRSVQRLEPDDDLALVSNCTPGKRLSEVLHHARGPAFAAELIRQLAPALVLLQQHGHGISHGALSLDRIVVSPEGRLTIVEHVVGPAIETLNLESAQLASMGIALPPAPADAAARLDVAADWYQLGLVAVSVLLGRQVTGTELPQLEMLLEELRPAAGRDGTVLSPWIRQWLDRALQISSGRIESSADAGAALDELLQQEQPRDSRRLESTRHEQAAPPAPSPASPLDPVADLTGDVAEARPAGKPSIFEVRPPAKTPRQPPQQTQVRFERASLSPFELEMLAGKKHHHDSGNGAGLHGPYVAARPPLQHLDAARQARHSDPPVTARSQPRAAERTGISRSVVAALLLIAAVEAGVIAWMAHALWLSPRPAIAVETAASGDNVLLSSDSTDVPPLRLAAAPDLRWVSVTSPSPGGILGGKVTTTQAGTIRISSPIALKVLEKSRLLGSVPGADLKVPAGRHDIELVNLALGFRLKHSLEVEAGESVSIHVAPPVGWVTVHAVPAAEVSIDGQAVGRTPLGPLPIAPGEHDVTFRHPTGLKDRQRVMIKSGETVRVIGNVRR
jgi:membrane protein YdbS with pleckstrin-like domain